MRSRYLTLAAAFCAAATLGGCSRTARVEERTTAPSAVTPDRSATAPAPAEEVADNFVDALRSLRTKEDAEPNGDLAMVGAAMSEVVNDTGMFAVNEEITRDDGPGHKVYAKAAPSIVVVKTKSGHGTGSLIDPRGWVLTNHHVIAKAVPDPATGAGMATIYMGKLVDGLMELNEQGLPALVYMSSKEKDLALLKIQSNRDDFPALKRALEAPKPPDVCVAIGHPKSGLLWTIREGKVAQVGNWPFDGVNALSRRVSSSPGEREDMRTKSQVRIVLSNCGINYGDSGGPLLNSEGELCAVTFAMPTEAGTASFAYHIHLEEVNRFLKVLDGKQQPSSPAPVAVDPWPAGAFNDLFDLDGDGTPDALAFSNTKGGPVTGLMLDLHQKNKIKEVGELNDQPRKWQFNVAIHFRPQPTAYYDTQMSGSVDLVMADRGAGNGIQIRRLGDQGNWTSEEAGRRPLLDPLLISDRAARERLAQIAKQLTK